MYVAAVASLIFDVKTGGVMFSQMASFEHRISKWHLDVRA
jgi:hypothetical protein